MFLFGLARKKKCYLDDELTFILPLLYLNLMLINFHIHKSNSDMKNVILLLFSFFLFQLTQAQVVFEDFEGGTADITWTGLNGTYDGVVMNTHPDAVNGTQWVGKYTKSALFDYCFAVGTLLTPVDLSKKSLFKMKVFSFHASTILLKFEGGGHSVEARAEVKTGLKWEELTFDMSAGADFTTMDKILIAFDAGVVGSAGEYNFDDIIAYDPRQDYETFENGAYYNWLALDGSFDGPIANPDSNSVNGSPNVGQYVKDSVEYSLLLADTGTPFDLSIMNQFHLQVRAQAPTQVLLKLEGSGGPPIEKTKNIGLTNEWQDYTFDFSAAADQTNLTKVVLFFDPGVKMSRDTYYFDNLYATPQGTCKNVTPDPNIIDDFECNRNATYVNGWDSLSVVNNPHPNSVNSSAKVGQYVDPVTEQWATILLDFQNPYDLSTKNQLHVKIWSPRIVPILFKLEGGSSPQKEIFMDVPDAGQWVNYVIDFSGEALANHTKLDFFFNAGQDPQLGDVYYIDDIYWSEKTDLALEDFEGGTANLPWEPLEQQTVLNGTFAVVDNPDASGTNTSAYVGEYTKGVAAFSTLAAVAPGLIDISSRPQYNLDVWAANPGTVTLQLESVTQGLKDVTRDIETGAAWQHVSFDFTDYQSISDWASLRLLFNAGVEEEGEVFYFDNLTQSQSTVDPCEGTVAIGNIIDDFECQRNHEPLAGAAFLSAVGNPLISTANSSTYVGLYHDQPAMPWDALCYDFPDGIDLSSFNQMSFQILSQSAVPILMKLEGGASGGSEIWTAVTKPGEWETLSVDFSNQVGGDYRRACIFFNGGVETQQVDDYFIDNVKFAHAPFTGCLINFDDAAFISDKWKFFPTDDSSSGIFELVDNPDPSGINTSAKVGKAVERSTSGQSWQGMYTDLPAPIEFGSNKIVKMKIWSPQVATVTMKIENSTSVPAGPNSGDNTVPNTKANEWEELSWDFSTTPITDDGKYIRVTLIWDINNLPASDVTYYFDDVQLTAGECGTTSLFGGPEKPRDLTISPNPVIDELRIDELGQVSRLEIHNMYGQRIASVWTGSETSTSVLVSNLTQGAYILTGYSAKGELLALSRFVKL